MRSKRSICCKSVTKAHVSHGHDLSSETRGRVAFFCFLGVLFLFSDWLIFCLGSLLCRFVVTLGFFSSDAVYNFSDIFGFWFWLTRDFSLDNDVPIHESSPSFDGDRPGQLVLYVWHFSVDTIFCDLTLRSSFQLVALRVENKMTPPLSWMLLWEELPFDKFGVALTSDHPSSFTRQRKKRAIVFFVDKIWGGTDVRPPPQFSHISEKKKRNFFVVVV